MDKKYNSVNVPDAPDNSYAGKKQNSGVKVKAASQTTNSALRSTFRNAVRGIATDIIFPTLKDLTYNTLSNFVGNMIYGVDNKPYQPQNRTIGRSMRNDYGALSRPSYSNRSAGIATDRFSSSRGVYDYQDIAWADDPVDIPNGMTGHQKAELARGALIDKLEENCLNNPNRPYVTVLDLKEIAMWNPITSVDDMWGWYDLSMTNTKVRRGLDGRWYITLPPVVSVR